MLNSIPSRLLVVDDEPDLCAILTTVFERSFEVVTCHSGNTALKFLAQVRVSLVLCDAHMPDGTGEDVLRGIAAGPGPRPPVIIFTASDYDRRSRGRGDGHPSERQRRWGVTPPGEK